MLYTFFVSTSLLKFTYRLVFLISWAETATVHKSVLVLKSSLTFGNIFCWFGLVNDFCVYVWIVGGRRSCWFLFSYLGWEVNLSGSYAGASESLCFVANVHVYITNTFSLCIGVRVNSTRVYWPSQGLLSYICIYIYIYIERERERERERFMGNKV